MLLFFVMIIYYDLKNIIWKEVKKQDLSHLTINGDNVSNPLTMAHKFNEFFTSIAKKTVENINPSPKSPVDLIQQNPNTFKFSDVFGLH